MTQIAPSGLCLFLTFTEKTGTPSCPKDRVLRRAENELILAGGGYWLDVLSAPKETRVKGAVLRRAIAALEKVIIKKAAVAQLRALAVCPLV